MNNKLAIELAPDGGFRGFGKLGLEEGGAGGAIGTFSDFVSSAIGLMTIIASIWFIFNFFVGAIGMIGAGGDKAGLENSRKKIVTSVIGLVVVISSIFLIQLVGYLIGISDILNLAKLFGQL